MDQQITVLVKNLLNAKWIKYQMLTGLIGAIVLAVIFIWPFARANNSTAEDRFTSVEIANFSSLEPSKESANSVENGPGMKSFLLKGFGIVVYQGVLEQQNVFIYLYAPELTEELAKLQAGPIKMLQAKKNPQYYFTEEAYKHTAKDPLMILKVLFNFASPTVRWLLLTVIFAMYAPFFYMVIPLVVYTFVYRKDFERSLWQIIQSGRWQQCPTGVLQKTFKSKLFSLIFMNQQYVGFVSKEAKIRPAVHFLCHPYRKKLNQDGILIELPSNSWLFRNPAVFITLTELKPLLDLAHRRVA